jgi:hypothetical protein
MLAHHVTQDNADKLLQYVERLNVEMQVLAVKTMTGNQQRSPHVQNTRRFTNWLLKHKDVFIASRT